MSVLAIAAQAEKIDSSQFVAFYNYTIQTQDGEGQDVTDSLRLALMVGTRATCCTDILSYNKDTGDIKLTSIPRDTLVTNPATGKLMPITNAYTSFDENGVFHDNPQRSIAIINYNFDMNIRYFFSINFYGVIKMTCISNFIRACF